MTSVSPSRVTGKHASGAVLTESQAAKPAIKMKVAIAKLAIKAKATKSYPKTKKSQYTLDWWKCHLDSCTSYHTYFVKEFLGNIGKDPSTMSANFNACTVLLKQKGRDKNFQVWLNKQGIVNLLSIPMLEEAGYKVSMHTDYD